MKSMHSWCPVYTTLICSKISVQSNSLWTVECKKTTLYFRQHVRDLLPTQPKPKLHPGITLSPDPWTPLTQICQPDCSDNMTEAKTPGDQLRKDPCWFHHPCRNRIKTYCSGEPYILASFEASAWLDSVKMISPELWFPPTKLGEGHTVQHTVRKLRLFLLYWMQTGMLYSEMNHNAYCPPFGYQASVMQRSHEGPHSE